MEPGLLSGTEWVQRERGPTTSSKAKGASSAAHPSQSQEPLASGTRATTPRRSSRHATEAWCKMKELRRKGAACMGNEGVNIMIRTEGPNRAHACLFVTSNRLV